MRNSLSLHRKRDEYWESALSLVLQRNTAIFINTILASLTHCFDYLNRNSIHYLIKIFTLKGIQLLFGEKNGESGFLYTNLRGHHGDSLQNVDTDNRGCHHELSQQSHEFTSHKWPWLSVCQGPRISEHPDSRVLFRWLKFVSIKLHIEASGPPYITVQAIAKRFPL